MMEHHFQLEEIAMTVHQWYQEERQYAMQINAPIMLHCVTAMKVSYMATADPLISQWAALGQSVQDA